MSEITREQLHAYLDEALSEPETARVEQALRDSEPLRRALKQAMQERDRGEHSLGAVWRRERLTCPGRDSGAPSSSLHPPPARLAPGSPRVLPNGGAAGILDL